MIRLLNAASPWCPAHRSLYAASSARRHSNWRKSIAQRSRTPQRSDVSDMPPFEPRLPRLTAAAVCAVAAFTLLWPLLTGHILFGGTRSDMFIAGYSFRLFGAETFK